MKSFVGTRSGLSIALAALLGDLVAQESKAREFLDTAGRHYEDRDIPGAARALRIAHIHSAGIVDPAVRAEVLAAVAALAQNVDPLLDKRRRLEQRLAASFLAIAERDLAANRPHHAGFAANDAGLLDSVLAADCLARIKAASAAAAGTHLEKLDAVSAGLLRIHAEMYDRIGEQVKKRERLPEWIVARMAAAAELRKLADEYRKQGWVETACEIAEAGFMLYAPEVREDLRVLQTLRLTQQAQERYRRFAQTHMEDLDRTRQTRGAGKQWRFKGMLIEIPPAAQSGSIVSGRKLTGDYRIELDCQCPIGSAMQLLVAWQSAADYVAVEFDTRAPGPPVVRIVRMGKGKFSTLAEARVTPQPRNYLTLSADVAKGEIRVALSGVTCSAKLPIETADGVSYGLGRPGLGRDPRKREQDDLILIRNIVITPL